MWWMFCWPIVVVVSVMFASAVAAQELQTTDNPTEAFYLTQVKPILSRHCFPCHADDPETISGGLALNSRAAIHRGGDSGAAIDLDNPAASILLHAINYEVYEMPPSGKLAAEDIAIMTRWVEMGTPFPAGEETTIRPSTHQSGPQVNAETKKWWSFQPVTRPQLPTTNQTEWARNEIDHFILANLEAVSLRPAPPATRQQLVRRAHYDLTGLPPTPEQVRAFVQNDSPDAYETLIDALLGSPHYGEKWGRHWLDLVRYAESNSFERDAAKPFVWRYRDYVIQSFNDDKPYDQFLTEQLAGDELAGSTPATLIATGYYRLGAWDDEPANPLQAKFDELDDMVATTSQTMLGLTVNCARCHDHKIDPIPQTDYYSFVSFFENIRRYGVRADDTVHAASVKTVVGQASARQQHKHAQEIRREKNRLEEIEAIIKPDFAPVELEDFQYESNRLAIVQKRVGSLLSGQQFEDYQKSLKRLHDLNDNPPGSIKVLCVKEAGSQPPTSHVRVRGNADITGDPIRPAFLSVLSPPQPNISIPESKNSTGRRLALAKWITSPDNPLTARVMANRLWQYHFGRGIVRSSSDFGFQGTPPTHPQLLDWLAAEFVQKNWSLKSMHRTIMLSNAYQMSGRYDPDAEAIDPANDRFWRFDLRRLTAEEIRDSMLAVTQQLNLNDRFGPSIFPELPAEVLSGQSEPGKGWGKSSPSDQRRRSIYIHVKRSLSVPLLSNNDSADTDNSCPVRFVTTQPTQALGMLNSRFINEQAERFAHAVAQQHPMLNQRISEVLSRVTQRQPTAEEVRRGVRFVQQMQTDESASEQLALTHFCLLALNLNEFVYID